LKHELGGPLGGSVTSGSEDDRPRKQQNRRSFSAPPPKRVLAPPAKECGNSEKAVDMRSDQADSSQASMAQLAQHSMHSTHNSPLKLSLSSSPERSMGSEPATKSIASEGKPSLTPSVKHQDSHKSHSSDVLEAVKETVGHDAAFQNSTQSIQDSHKGHFTDVLEAVRETAGHDASFQNSTQSIQDSHENQSTDVPKAVKGNAGHDDAFRTKSKFTLGIEELEAELNRLEEELPWAAEEELPPGGSNAAAASPEQLPRLPKLPSSSPAKVDGGKPTLLEALTRPSTTPRPNTSPALPPVRELDRNTPRPATSSMPRSPWWGSAGSPRSPRFAATQSGSPAARKSPGVEQDDAAKERGRQLRTQQWAQVGAQLGAVPADSPLLKRLSSKGSSGKSP